MISSFWIGTVKREMNECAALTAIAFSIWVDGLGANYSSTEAKKEERIALGGL